MKRILIPAGMILTVSLAALAGSFGTDRLMSALRGGADGGSEGPPGAAAEESTRVTAASPRVQTIRETFETAGTILPVRSIEVRPLSEGRVVEVAAASGAAVSEGDPIFSLDARAERAALAEAEATLTETEAAFLRYEELQDENVAADARLEQARAAFRRAEAMVEVARAALADRRVAAPLGGVLGVMDLDVGERVDPATIVTSLDDLSTVLVEFAVPERYFGDVERGQTVTITAAAYPDRTFEGQVAFAALRIGENSRSFTVRASLNNEDRMLVGGMFVDVALVMGTRESLTVPDDAIVSEGSATYVFVLADGVAARTDVSLGIRQDGRSEVVDGLAEDAQVLTTGFDTLSDGDPVSVEEDGAAEEALN